MSHDHGGHGAVTNDDDDKPRTLSASEVQAKYLRKLEKRLPGGKKLKRMPIVKLELGEGDIIDKIGIVSQRVFGLEHAHGTSGELPSVPSRNYQHWRISDDTLYGEAKSAYDGIFTPFTRQPRVYKLESIKEKVWEMTRDRSAEEEAEKEAEYLKKQELLKERRKKMDAKMKAKPPPVLGAKGAEKMAALEEAKIEFIQPSPFATKDEELETFLDPFEPPKPWIKEVWNNKISYLNEDTKERLYTRPKGAEIWVEKAELLSKLTPREDLDGYEYRENDAERRRRVRQMAEFDRLMKDEIQRRENEPHDVEVIEDVLYELIEAIHMRDERKMDLMKKREKRALKATWHTICKGYRMKPLVPIENELGELETAVTDLDFTNMIISHTGHMLSLQTPPGFYEKHEAERAVQRAIDEEKRKLEEFERNRPLKDKARIVMALARRDPKAAAKRVAAGIKEKALSIPRTLGSLDRKTMVQMSQRLIMNGFLSLVKAGKDPRATLTYVQDQFKKVYAEMFPKEEADEEMEALLKELSGEKTREAKEEGPVESEAAKKKRLWLASQPKPVKHADTVLVRMTFLIDPPPMYVVRPQHTWKDDLVEAEAILRHQHMLNKELAQHKFSKHFPGLVDSINAGLAILGRDAIEIDEEYHQLELQRIEKERKRRKPLKPWETRRAVSPPPRKPKKVKMSNEVTVLGEGDLAGQSVDVSADSGAAVSVAPFPDVADTAVSTAAKESLEKTEIDNAIIDTGITLATDLPSNPAPEYLPDTTGGADPTAPPADATIAPLSPDRRGKSVKIPKIGPLPPMEIYVPHRDEIKEKLKALPQDVERLKERMRERMKTMPKEVRDKVRRIIDEIQNPPPPKNIYDTRERDIFERMLVQEISQAVFLPAANIKIEEIRRLEKNSSKLLALQRRHIEREEDHKIKAHEKHVAHEHERERRKKMMESHEEHFLVAAAKEFIEEQAENWGFDIEKVSRGRMIKTVYRGPVWHKHGDPQGVTDFKGRPIPLTHPHHPHHDPAIHGPAAQARLLLQNNIDPGGAVDTSIETGWVRLENDEMSLNSASNFPEPPVAGSVQSDGERVPPLLNADSASPPSSIKHDALVIEPSVSSEVLDGASGTNGSQSLSLGGSKSGSVHSKTQPQLPLPLPDQTLPVPPSEIILENRKASNASELTRRSAGMVIQSETISEEEIARLTRTRAQRLLQHDEKIVNLMEDMCAEVVTRAYFEQQAEELALWSTPESKIINGPPAPPEFFKLGVRNPEALKFDPNYWLAKAIRPATKVELRERRLARLRMSQRKEGLELRMQQLRELKELIVYDAVEYYDEKIDPIVEGVLKPFARKVSAQLKAKMDQYGKTLQRLAYGAKSKLLQKLQEGLTQLSMPTNDAILAIEMPTVLTREDIARQYDELWRHKALLREGMLVEVVDCVAFLANTVESRLKLAETMERAKRLSAQRVAAYNAQFLISARSRVSKAFGSCAFDSAMNDEGPRAEEIAPTVEDGPEWEAWQERLRERSETGLMYQEERLQTAVAAESIQALVAAMDSLCSAVVDRSTLSAEDLDVLEKAVFDQYPDSVQVSVILDETVTKVVDALNEREFGLVATAWCGLQGERKVLQARRAEIDAEERAKEELRLSILSNDNLRSLGKLSAEEEAALAEEEEKNISAELLAIRNTQAAQEAEAQMRANFRRLRRQRRKVYDADVVDLLNKMCIAVELCQEYGEDPMELLPDIEDDYDLDNGKAETESMPPTPRPDSRPGSAPTEIQEGDMVVLAQDTPGTDEKEEEEEPVLGCEVSFMIYVTDKEREVKGLEDLEAEDVAVMLLQQFENPHSQLRSGYLGKTLLDVEYKLPFKKKLFSTWESFWVHVIHPVFFYRTAGKSLPKKEKESDGRLESGLIMVNPTWEFSERSKDTFMLYQKKYLKKPKPPKAGEVVDAAEAALKEQIAKKAAEKKAKNAGVVNLEVDEFASDVRNLVIVRPNMSQITRKDVERLRRIAGAFDEAYKKEMLKGLVDGQRLHIAQYETLKNRDTANRIYMNAKAKFYQKLRNVGMGDDTLLPQMVTTHVSSEQFDEWMDELRKEQSQNLRALCEKKAADRELRDQEMALRRRFAKQRHWIINYKLNKVPNPQEVGPAVQREFNEFNEQKARFTLKDMNESDEAKFMAKQTKLQEFIISDEKATRAMFDVITKWVHRKNRRLASTKLKSMQISRKRRDSAMYTAMLLGLSDLDAKATQNLKKEIESLGKIAEETDSSSSDGGENENDDAEANGEHDSENEEKEHESGEFKLDEIAAQTGGKRRGRTSFKLQIPFVFREELLSFLEVYFLQLAHEQMLKEEEEKDIQAAKLEVAERRQSMSLTGQQSKMSEKEEIKQAIEARRRSKALLQASPGVMLAKRRGSIKDSIRDAPQRRVSLAVVDASGLEAKSTLDKVRNAGLMLLPEEMDMCREVHWVRVVKDDSDFYDALKGLPLQKEPKVARDEIIQFASVLCEIVPILGRVGRTIAKEKEEALVAAGFRGKKDLAEAERQASGMTKKEAKAAEREAALREREKNRVLTPEEAARRAAEAEAKAIAAGMGEEGLRRLRKAQDALQRQSHREKAWLMAHPHRFIRYPGKMAFCIVCKVKEYEIWLEEFNLAEKSQVGVFEEDLMDNMEDAQPMAEREFDIETSERLAKVEEDLRQQYSYENRKAAAARDFEEQIRAYEKSARAIKKAGGKAPPRPQKPFLKPYDYNNTEMKRWRVKRVFVPQFTELHQRIPDGIVQSELPLVDADGASILPPPPEEEGEVAESSDEEDGAEHTHESKGLKVRVWQKDGPGLRGAFLGSVHLKEEEVLDPPKGMRTYPLRSDPYITKRLEREEKTAVQISGSITLMLKIDKFDKLKSGEKIPRRWKFQIMRAARLACADRLKGTTAFCEVFWMGVAYKDGAEEDFSGRWLMVGETKEKAKTVEPVWNREDNSVYDLPPVWTELGIKGRGPGGDELKGGGWVAQNQIPSPPDYSAYFAAKERKSRRMLKALMFMVLAVIKIKRVLAEVRAVAIRRKIETLREFWLSEERERKFLAREEKRARKHYIEAESLKAQPLLERQMDFEREFSRLVMYIKEPPKVLARLRFMMGSESDGGMIAMCEDPATHKMVNVMSVPILYPEDEEDLCSQMQALIGKQNANLTTIIDFSVHAVRLYAQTGFPGIDQRIALAVLERYEGETFLEFILKEWSTITNDEFRLLLAQIINGLVDLHAEGIIHRNFYEKCVIVRRPSHIIEEEKAMGRKVAHPPKVPNLRIGEYWFLNNPRKSGCLYSLGRADWGARSTVPPEALNGNIIDDKSDIYAFGVCVYHWATGGRTLPQPFNIEEIARHIPLKWTSWVHALLRMCLNLNPRARASAQEIKRFLSRRVHGQI